MDVIFYRDEDMQSIVSLLSVNNNHDHDIAPLDDLEDIPDIDYDMSEHVLDFTAQLEQLTNSLTGSDVATPMSGKPKTKQSVFFTNVFPNL